MTALNTFGITCRARRVIQHVDIVFTNKFRLKLDLRCVAASFSDLIEGKYLELELFGSFIPERKRLFIVIKHHYVSDDCSEALSAHIQNFLKISSCAEYRLKSCLLEDVIYGFHAHRVVEPNDSSLVNHRSKLSSVPLPFILGPDGAEGPLFTIFIDSFNRF